MNRNIPTFWALGIISSLCILIAGGVILLSRHNFFVAGLQNTSEGYKVSSNIRDAYYKPELRPGWRWVSQLGDDYQGDFPDVGTSEEGEGTLVYSTLKRLGDQCTSDSGSIRSFYIRNIDGSYNKRLFSFHNTSQDSVSATVVFDKGKGKFDMNIRSQQSDKRYLVDSSGSIEEVLKEEKTNNFSQEITSPDGTRIARAHHRDDPRLPNTVEVLNTKTGSIKRLEFDNGYSGVYIDSWTDNGKWLYVVGSLYEFSAPARLWRYDIEKDELKEYTGLEGLVFPVTVFPEEEVAYARDGIAFNNPDENFRASLYSINLNSGEIQKVLKEDGSIGTFIHRSGNEVYYQVFQNENKPEERATLRKLDIRSGKTQTVLENARVHFTDYNISPVWTRNSDSDFFTFVRDSELFGVRYSDVAQIYSLGEQRGRSCYDIVPEKEYFYEVLGASF